MCTYATSLPAWRMDPNMIKWEYEWMMHYVEWRNWRRFIDQLYRPHCAIAQVHDVPYIDVAGEANCVRILIYSRLFANWGQRKNSNSEHIRRSRTYSSGNLSQRTSCLRKLAASRQFRRLFGAIWGLVRFVPSNGVMAATTPLFYASTTSGVVESPDKKGWFLLVCFSFRKSLDTVLICCCYRSW